MYCRYGRVTAAVATAAFFGSPVSDGGAVLSFAMADGGGGGVSATARAEMSAVRRPESTIVNINNGLLLYYHQCSFYSQKVSGFCFQF